jgi:hypothetical protein
MGGCLTQPIGQLPTGTAWRPMDVPAQAAKIAEMHNY